MAWKDLPACFFIVLRPFLLSVPRSMSRIRCTCRQLRDYLNADLKKALTYRIFYGYLHTQSRQGCIECMSKFTLAKGCISFTVKEIRLVFRCIFDTVECTFLRSKAISMLFKVSEKFSYAILVSEFVASEHKEDFLRLLRDCNESILCKRDATKCSIIKKMLYSKNHNLVALSLCILRSFIHKCDGVLLKKIRSCVLSNNIYVSHQASLCLSTLHSL